MTTLQALRKVRKRIERGWTRGELARDRSGKRVPVDSPRACRWCLYGAAMAVCPRDGILYRNVLCCLHSVIQREINVLGDWNDAQKSKQAVLAAIDRAIEREAQVG